MAFSCCCCCCCYVCTTGIPPDLGIPEAELLGRAFDHILHLSSIKRSSPHTDGSGSTDTPETSAGSSNNNGRNDGNADTGRREHSIHSSTEAGPAITSSSAEEKVSSSPSSSSSEVTATASKQGYGYRSIARRPSSARGHGNASSSGSSRLKSSDSSSATDDVTPKTSVSPDGNTCPRVPAREIIRLLLGGFIEDFRRESPSLTAACIFSEFSLGLECAAGDVTSSPADIATITTNARIRQRGSEGAVKSHQEVEDEKVVANEEQGSDCTAGRSGGSKGNAEVLVSKAEFREYFQAVTDLVDLNGLSLVSLGEFSSCSTVTNSDIDGVTH